MTDKKKAPDVVADGGIKKPECGFIRSTFGMCSRGESGGGLAAPTMPNVAPMNPEGQKVIVDKAAAGDYGGNIQNTTNAIQNRMKALENAGM